jgi:hypothetical protein
MYMGHNRQRKVVGDVKSIWPNGVSPCDDLYSDHDTTTSEELHNDY